MLFGDMVRMLRVQKGLTQEEFAKAVSISLRTIQNYESGKMYPRKREYLTALAEFFGVSENDLISNEDKYIINAHNKGGARAKRDVQDLVTELTGLFAGGSLSDADKDNVMLALNQAYWKSKEINRKYTRKDYINDESESDDDTGEQTSE